MNFTVNELASLEDTLVQEITEGENRCELEHINGATCSVTAVAVSAARCSRVTQLACEVGVRRTLHILNLCEATGTKCPCGRKPSECWSVVILP